MLAAEIVACAEEQGEVEIEIASFLAEIGPCASRDSHSHRIQIAWELALDS